jgi:putative pyrimidine permease RutG
MMSIDEERVERAGYFPYWKVKTSGMITPEERLPWGQTIFFGLQNGVVMAVATVIPLITGSRPNLVLFFAGLGTFIFFVIVGGRVESKRVVHCRRSNSNRLQRSRPQREFGRSIGWVRRGWRALRDHRVGGHAFGVTLDRAIDAPVVTGSVIGGIGVNLASIAIRSTSGSALDACVGLTPC